MARLRSLWGRIPWGSRHWTQAPAEQGIGGLAIPLVGVPRDRALIAFAAPDRALAGIRREFALLAAAPPTRALQGMPRERALIGGTHE